MFQILENNSPQSQKFAAISKLLNSLGNAGAATGEALQGKSEREALGKMTGQDLSNVRNKDFLNQILGSSLRQKEAGAKMQGAFAADQESKEVIGKYFGPSAAEIWPHLTEGGKTELFRSLMLGKERGQEVNEILSEYLQQNPKEAQNIASSISGEDQILPIEEQPSVKSQSPKRLSSKAEEDILKKQIEESEKYHKETREKYQRAQTLKPVFSELRDVVEAGGADALSMGNIADMGNKIGGFLGTTLNALGKAQESGDTGRFRSLSKRLLDEMKDIFGGQIRVKELEVFLSMIPEIGKSREANLASIDVLERLSQASSMFYETAEEIIDKNNGKIPANLADQVQKKLGPALTDLAKNITSATKSYKQSSKKLTSDIAKQLLDEAKGDKELARKLAKQRGYEF